MKKKLFWTKFHRSSRQFLQNVINVWRLLVFLCFFFFPSFVLRCSPCISWSIDYVYTNRWSNATTRPCNSLAITYKCSALVICHWFGFSVCWCNPTIPRHIPESSTSQEIFPQGSFPSPPCFGEMRKFSCLEISGAVPSWPQGEECALIGFLSIIRHSIRCRL